MVAGDDGNEFISSRPVKKSLRYHTVFGGIGNRIDVTESIQCRVNVLPDSPAPGFTGEFAKEL
jgi:hypothetical protein